MNSQWAKDLRERMETHEESSPEGLWDDIEQTLRKEKDRAIVPPVLFGKGRLFLLSKQIGTAAAIALVVLSTGYFSMNKNQEKDLSTGTQMPYKEQDKPEIKPASSPKHLVTDNLITSNIDHVAAHKESDNTGQTAEYSSYEKREDFTITTTNDRQIEEINIKPLLRSSECLRPLKNASGKYYDYTYAYNSTTDQYLNSNTKCNVSAFASNLPVSIQNKYNGLKDFSAADIDIERITGVTLLGEDPFADILIYNKYVETQTSIKHKQPVTGGLTVNYSLNSHWGLISGVTYTILSSQLRSGSEHYYFTSEQTLHYLGIPLNICYNVWRNETASVYFAGGGIIERNISGKLTTEYFVNDEKKSVKEENLSVDQLQYSLNISAGAQYNISEKICVFSEPGISYYFKNSSKTETIYKQRPVNISLHFGISLLW